DWPSMSMKPGATTLPPASMVRLRGAVVRLPMAAILPSRMPTSPEYHGEPVPSMMWPLVMTRSKADGVCAIARRAHEKTNNSTRTRRGPNLASIRAPLVRDYAQRNPNPQRQPFVHREMARHRGDDFHQQHCD